MNDKTLAILLASFPSNESEDELRAIMQSYDLALEGIAPHWVEHGVKAFIQGRVPGHNPSFRPRPAELAAFARPLHNQEREAAEAEKRRLLQLEDRGRDEPTPEEKAAVQAKLKEFRQNVAEILSMDPVNIKNRGPAHYPKADETKAVLQKYYGSKNPNNQ